MMGARYLVDHCFCEYEQKLYERRYRAYVTDVLNVLNENFASQFGGKGMTQRWVDAYLRKEERTAEEIAADVIRSAGLVWGGDG